MNKYHSTLKIYVLVDFLSVSNNKCMDGQINKKGVNWLSGFFYRAMWLIICPILKILAEYFCHLEIINIRFLKNLTGPAIIYSNHISPLSPPILAISIPWRHAIIPVRFLTAEDIFPLCKGLLGVFLAAMGCIPVNRNKSIKSLKKTLESAKNILNNGGVIGIFPEGKSSFSKELLPFQSGTAYLVHQFPNVTILPAVVYWRPQNFTIKDFFMRNTKATVVFGEVFHLKNSDRRLVTKGLELKLNIYLDNFKEGRLMKGNVNSSDCDSGKKQRRRIEISPASYGDIDDCVDVCNKVWKGIFQADRDMLESRLRTFSQGGLVVGKIDGQVEGYVSIQLIKGTIFPSSWNETTDSGTMRKTHDENGDWMFGIGIAVTPKGSHCGLTIKLLLYLGKYMVANNKKGAYFVTRMPRFHRFKNKMSPEEYAISRKSGRPLDAELALWEKYGFQVVEPPIIVKDYVEGGGDPNSCGYGVLIRRTNPFYGWPIPKLWSLFFRV